MENMGRADLSIVLALANLLDALPKASKDRQLLEIIARHNDFQEDLEKYLAEVFSKRR